tara:strand:- start:1357 stop:1863 length:507 start_codon:yes stop_codon:yes gene_type:complete
MIIPGQSLTAEPKAAPYENPPEMNTEEDAIMWHLERLSEEDRMEALVDTLELGVDVVTLTEGILRGAVLEGRHSIDISLVIAPVIHEFIKTTAEKMNIDFEEGLPDDSEERIDIEYQINERKAKKMLEELDMDEGTDVETVDEPIQEELPMDMPMMKPKGLMAKRGEV